MKMSKKIALILAAIFIAVGLLVSFGAAVALEFDFTKMNTVEFVTNTYPVSEQFTNISIKGNECDIRFLPSEDGTCRIVCQESDKIYHSVKVEKDTLTIERHDERKWYEHIGVFIGDMSITVYLPEQEYNTLDVTTSVGDVDIPETFSFEKAQITTSTGNVVCASGVEGSLSIKTDTGHTHLSNIAPKSLDIESSTGSMTVNSVTVSENISIDTDTGKVRFTDVACQNLTAKSSTGDMNLKNVIVSGDCHIKTATGRVDLFRFDAGSIYVETDTGDVSGTLLSEKIFITETDTGKIDVPKTTTGGRCEIITDTGDIRIELE